MAEAIPVEYSFLMKLTNHDAMNWPSYFRMLKERGIDTEEAEINYNIFAKWFNKRHFNTNNDVYSWSLLKDFMEFVVVHYHTVLDRLLFGINNNDVIETNVQLNDKLIQLSADFRICSRLFVDWGAERWPLLEVPEFLADFLLQTDFRRKGNTENADEMTINNILQAFPGFAVTLPKDYLSPNNGGYLSHIIVAHEIDDQEYTSYISIVMIDTKYGMRVVKANAENTISECLKRNQKYSYFLKLAFGLLLYFMVEPDEVKTPSFRKESDTIIIHGIEEKIEVWKAARLGVKIGKENRRKWNIAVTHHKKPHWRKGHWRYYKSCEKLTWVKPMLINKHLI